MSPDQFWYEDIDVFYAYQKAYQNRTNYAAWLNGLYVQRAIDTSIYNTMPYAISLALNGSKGEHKSYDYFDRPIDQKGKVDGPNIELTERASVFTEDGYTNGILALNKISNT